LPEKAATAGQIATLLVNKGLKADEWTQNVMIMEWALEIGVEGSVLDEALIAAGKLNWIDQGPKAGTTRLTKAGFEAGAAR
jgi:hypothetical protein